MVTYLDIENWNRKDQFYFFKDYDNPFFNICTDLDVMKLYNHIKSQGISFFQASLYLSLRSINEIQEFRYRIRGDKIIIHDVIHAGSTVLNSNETFSFCYFEYESNFKQFSAKMSEILKKNENKKGGLDAHDDRDDLVHYSMIPWISFTSFTHARRFNHPDSIPKIVFGKYHNEGNRMEMAVSVEVHHSLIDGVHVAKFFDLFQHYLDSAENILESKN